VTGIAAVAALRGLLRKARDTGETALSPVLSSDLASAGNEAAGGFSRVGSAGLRPPRAARRRSRTRSPRRGNASFPS
jgi:hypothetical protein